MGKRVLSIHRLFLIEFLLKPRLALVKFDLVMLKLFDFISSDCKQVESNFSRSVLLNPHLNLLSCFWEPVFLIAFSKTDWTRLKSIQFVELSFKGHKADEMEDIVIFSGILWFLLFHEERILSSKTVVGYSNFFWVSNDQTFGLRIHILCKIFKIF